MLFVLNFELILIIGSNNVLTEGARKVYRGRRVGQGWISTTRGQGLNPCTIRKADIFPRSSIVGYLRKYVMS
jgi:hypothetical protein